jgi:predicted metal-dependent peptidase
LIDDEKPPSIKEFFDLSSFISKDESPEGEYEAIRLSKARTSLFLDMPFFGYILGNLEIYPTSDPNIPSYACDTRRIYINPSFTADKKKEQLMGMLMHLVVHLIMQHGKRSGIRNEDIWSLSTDIATRLIVDDAREKLGNSKVLKSKLSKNQNRFDFDPSILDKFWVIEQTSTIPDLLKYESADAVFKVLSDYANSLEGIQEPSDEEEKKDRKDKINWRSKIDPEIMDEVHEYSGIDNPCGFGYAMDVFLDNTSDEVQSLEDNRFTGIIRNGLMGRDIGNLPSSMKTMINDLVNPKIPWYTLLAQYIQKAVISDWKWIRPNKRLVGLDINLPSTIRENLNVIVAVDTSGSISNEELIKFTSETHSILSNMASVRMTIIDCDAKVQNVVEIENGQSIDGSKLPWEGRPWTGRGGTSFVPVFNYVEEQGINPELLIYFTDGYGNFPSEEPAYPVLWVMTTDVYPPFGEIIEYTE